MNLRRSGIRLLLAPKHPCPICGKRLWDLDLMAHRRWHRNVDAIYNGTKA